jgi:hypothetical protein
VNTNLAEWSLIFLCFSMAGSFGGGLYEHIVVTPYGVRRRHRRLRSFNGVLGYPFNDSRSPFIRLSPFSFSWRSSRPGMT